MRVLIIPLLAIALYSGSVNGGWFFSSGAKKPCEVRVSTRRAVFFELDGTKQLLSTPKVAHGTKVKFVCGDNSIKPIKALCNRGVLKLPDIDMCKAEQTFTAVLRPVAPFRRIKLCAAKNIDYTVGYRPKTRIFDLYRVCFNKDSLTPLFTKHRIFGGKREIGQQPDEKLILKKMFKDLLEKFSSINEEDIKERLKSKPDVKLVPLVPAADFAFDWQRKDAYKFPNLVLQFKSVYYGNWRKVEEWVRDKASKIDFKEYLTVYTGTYGVLKVNNTEIYLHPKKKIPVPEYTFKVVSQNGNCDVFVTRNNILEKLNAPICTGSCPTGLKFEQSKEAGESSCCSVGEFKKKFFPNLSKRLCKNE